MKKIIKVFIILIILSLWYGCTSRPALTKAEEVPYNEAETLIKAAKADISEAKKAGAEKYAKNLIANAESSIVSAESTLKLKDFEKAKESAQKASSDAKAAKSMPSDAETAIKEAEDQLSIAKETKADEESPESFKSAQDSLEAAKSAIAKKNYLEALNQAKSSVESAKKSIDDPANAKSAVTQAENDMQVAKELQIDKIAPEIFAGSSESLELAKTSLTSRDNSKAKEFAEKASNDLREKMKSIINLNMEQAKSDIDNAKNAGAAELSSDLLGLAEESISNAASLLEKGDYLNAKVSTEKASTIAKEAESKAKLTSKTGNKKATNDNLVAESSGDKSNVHTVKVGEYLWKISRYKSIYGDPLLWPLLYHANTDKIKDPGLIFAKQELKVPRDLTEAEIKQARKEALETPGVYFRPATERKPEKTRESASSSGSTDKPEDTNLATTSSTTTQKTSGFPIIPIIIVVLIIAVIFGVRYFRKKTTTKAAS